MKKEIKSLRVLMVDWVDSENHIGWEDEERAQKTKLLTLASVGLEVKSDDEKVILAIGYNERNKDFSQVQVIPRCSIKRVVVLGRLDL